ncbi:dihydroxyacetone kinase subunit DhaK [Gracilibacillus caseinilyticus]|uniref:Dihydroxyacetone kinase subunit DhaK n=1 Tax=Gracilibacillus caseinilyticus TaxID=2932256 RepID=A0ABY4EVI3_9BACI|nr:dihydroxyacetone kinase subunit DhaK [Gracilibacillus caseinilyticus]UOQ48411.1 dihydroxyacetone kinase subunit DhaK [Gracilibacillus caseinilyticus]
MKKVLNHTDAVVEEMLDGFVKAHSDSLKRLPDTSVVIRNDAPVTGKVGIVSGGGSGHEPAHAGYVGKGMLDAAVAGEVFTSPTPDQVLEAIKAVDSGEGVLLIIKNYTGDVMNFDMAAELAEAEGITVEKVIVNDDVSVEDSTFTSGRRGIAGTVFVHKVAGAIAETKAPLQEVKAAAENVIKQVRSMGVALSPCTVPASGKPSFTLEEDEMEIGIGIHGEPGIERVPLQSADRIADTLLGKILADHEYDNSEVAVMINGMGATPEMELYIVYRQVANLLKEKGITIYANWVGEYMTALEMAGFSITLLKLDHQIKSALSATTDAQAFK